MKLLGKREETMNLTLLVAALVGAGMAHAQVQGGGRGAVPVLGATPKPAIPNAKKARSCESLAAVALPNTTIESAAVDPNNPAICRVSAITTHPPAGDRVRIWIAMPTSDWNGRFVGNGGVGFSGGNSAGVNQAAALGLCLGLDRHGTRSP